MLALPDLERKPYSRPFNFNNSKKWQGGVRTRTKNVSGGGNPEVSLEWKEGGGVGAA